MLELLKRLAPATVLVLTFSFGMYVGSVTKDNEWKEEVHNEYVTKTEARASTQREVVASLMSPSNYTSQLLKVLSE